MRTEGLDFEGHRAVYRTLGARVRDGTSSASSPLRFVEPLFIDMEYVKRASVFKRASPGALRCSCCLEGLIMQTGLIHGTGMAYLGGGSYRVAVLEATVRVRSKWSTSARRRRRPRAS